MFEAIREQSPGTSVWFLTGTEDADFSAELGNDYGRTEDIHCRQRTEQMYCVIWKKRIDDCIKRACEFDEQLATVDRIALRVPQGINLSTGEQRTLKLFGRRYNAVSLDVTALNGGLSDSRVLKVVVRDGGNAERMTVVAKVGLLKSVRDEFGRYESEIVRLQVGGYPSLSLKIEVGAGNFGGLFYGMVGSHAVVSLFQRLANVDEGVANVPPAIRAIQATWYNSKTTERLQVAQIRRRLLPDTSLDDVHGELAGIDIAAIEAVVVTVSRCCQHNDLHCANVVFDHQGKEMLIDFNDAGLSFAALDPVTLELSTVFHAQRTTLPGGWPVEALMAQWINIDAYTEGCTYSEFIRACRSWALDVAGSQEEVVAIAYAYAMRQLKYADTDKILARALIFACIDYLTNPREGTEARSHR